MHCRNCGNKLKASSRFCSKCGARSAGAGEKAALSHAEKRRNRKRMPLLAVLAACILAAVVSKYYIDTKKEPVKFEDFLVERCVREALDKSWDEDILENEAASIKELTIDWKKGMTVGLDLIKYHGRYVGYVNLADLQYLTGLKSLRLDFPPAGNDIFENIDAVTNCKDLEQLAMPLALDGYDHDSGYLGRGYRYWSDIFSKLPRLDKVDFGVTLPADIQEQMSSSTGRQIAFVQGKDFQEYVAEVSTNGHALWVAEESSNDNERTVITPTELSPDVEDAVIYVHKGEVFDCQNLAPCTQLKTLIVYGDNSLKGEPVQVANMNLLAKLPYLSSVSFVGADINLADFKGIPGLRELYLSMCSIQNISELQNFASLCELYMSCNQHRAAEYASALSEAWKSLPDLHYFYGCWNMVADEAEAYADEAYGNIKEAENLQTLVLSEMPGGINLDGPVLKTLFLYPVRTGALDLRKLRFNKSLENFFAYIGEPDKYFPEFINTHPNLITAVTAIAGWSDGGDNDAANAAYYNDVINAAIQNENISWLEIANMGYTGLSYKAAEAVEWGKLDERKIYNRYLYLNPLRSKGD